MTNRKVKGTQPAKILRYQFLGYVDGNLGAIVESRHVSIVACKNI